MFFALDQCRFKRIGDGGLSSSAQTGQPDDAGALVLLCCPAFRGYTVRGHTGGLARVFAQFDAGQANIPVTSVSSRSVAAPCVYVA